MGAEAREPADGAEVRVIGLGLGLGLILILTLTLSLTPTLTSTSTLTSTPTLSPTLASSLTLTSGAYSGAAGLTSKQIFHLDSHIEARLGLALGLRG